MAFYIGQKVVCIDPTWGSATGSKHQLRYCPNLPELNAVYTIRGLHQGSVLFIWLNEIHNQITTGTEPFFEAHKFRPVVEASTDISIFTAMLGPKLKEEV